MSGRAFALTLIAVVVGILLAINHIESTWREQAPAPRTTSGGGR